MQKFRAFIADKNRKYHYSYKVNYKGSSQPMVKGPFESDDTSLTIDVDALGILVADIAPGDLNFTQVKQAQVKVRYQDSGVQPIERQFTLASDKSTFQIREVIQKPRTQPIKYAVKYFMSDGREYEVAEKEQDAPQIYINDPFSAMKTVGLRAVGDLNAKIQSITVDLTYRDEAHHNYTQTRTLALSKAMAFFDWTFPVIDENAGVLTYSGSIQYADGTTRDIPETSAARSTIQVGDIMADRLAVTIVPDLLDFSLLRLAKVTMKYSADATVPSKDFIFKSGDETKNWVVELKDKTKRDYKWSAEFFMTDKTKKTLLDQIGDGDTVILELPA